MAETASSVCRMDIIPGNRSVCIQAKKSRLPVLTISYFPGAACENDASIRERIRGQGISSRRAQINLLFCQRRRCEKQEYQKQSKDSFHGFPPSGLFACGERSVAWGINTCNILFPAQSPNHSLCLMFYHIIAFVIYHINKAGIFLHLCRNDPSSSPPAQTHYINEANPFLFHQKMV